MEEERINLSEFILTGKAIKVLPISEDNNLYKFCYLEDLHDGKTLWGICTKTLEQLCSPIYESIEIDFKNAYIKAFRNISRKKEVSILTLQGEHIASGDFNCYTYYPSINIIKYNKNHIHIYDKNWKELLPLISNSFREEDCNFTGVIIYAHKNNSTDYQTFIIIDKNHDNKEENCFIVELSDMEFKIRKNLCEEVKYFTTTDDCSIHYTKFEINKNIIGIIISRKLYLMSNFDKIEKYSPDQKSQFFKIYKDNFVGLFSYFEVIPPIFDKIKFLSDTYFAIYKDNSCQLLDLWDIQPYNFKWHYYALEKKPKYQEVEYLHDGFFKILHNGFWGIMKYDKIITPTIYDEIVSVNSNIYARKDYQLDKIFIDRVNCSFQVKNKRIKIINNFSNAYENLNSNLFKFDSNNINLIDKTAK